MDMAVENMSETLNDVLSYQKIEEGKLELASTSFNVHNALESVKSIFDIPAKAKSINLQLAIDAAVPASVVSDPHRIRQVE